MKPVSIRASSLSEYLDCQLRFKARQIDGIKMQREISLPAVIGSAVHLGVGYFDGCLISNETVSVAESCEFARDYVTANHHGPKSELKHAWTTTTELVMAYCNTLHGTEHHRIMCAVEPKIPNAEIIAEHIKIELTGTPDRLYRVDNQFGIMDIKTGAYAFSLAGRAPQLGIYEYLIEQAGYTASLPSKIISVGNRDKKTDVAVSNISNAREMTFGSENHCGIIPSVARSVATDTFLGNPRSALCSERYCPIYPCHFVEKSE